MIIDWLRMNLEAESITLFRSLSWAKISFPAVRSPAWAFDPFP